jgi:hypothetical protein
MPRRNDGAVFAYHVHKKFFVDMRNYLKSIGVRIPITATGRFEDIADLKSMSEELDFIGSNFYYDHPYWAQGAKAWTPPSFFHNHNPMSDIDDRSMAAAVSLARIKNKPFVVREWNYCWPNRNRAAGMVEAAAYASLHDIDAMILFVYETVPTARVSYFNVRSDPTRWGLCGVGAQIFLQGLIKPSRHRIVVPYNTVDTFTYTRYHQPFYALGWATRVENDFMDGEVYRSARNSADLIVPPGRSGVGLYTGAPAVLHTESLNRDLAGRTVYAPLSRRACRCRPFWPRGCVPSASTRRLMWPTVLPTCAIVAWCSAAWNPSTFCVRRWTRCNCFMVCATRTTRPNKMSSPLTQARCCATPLRDVWWFRRRSSRRCAATCGASVEYSHRACAPKT